MSKLTRVLQRVFGSSAGPDQISQFGSLFAGSPAFTTDPAVVQSLSNWLTGWDGAAIGGNAPAIEDMNAILYVLSYQLAYLMQQGIPEWETGTTYYIGSYATDATGIIYKSLQNNNTGNALTNAAYWQRNSLRPKTETVAIDTTLTGSSGLVRVNAGSGAVNLTLPDATANDGQIIYIKKIDGTANAVNLIASGTDTIDGASSYGQLNLPYMGGIVIASAGAWSVF